MIRFACPHCGQDVQAEGWRAMTEVDCPSCGQRVVVPGPPLAATSGPVIPPSDSAESPSRPHPPGASAASHPSASAAASPPDDPPAGEEPHRPVGADGDSAGESHRRMFDPLANPPTAGEALVGLALAAMAFVFPILGAVTAVVAIVYWMHVYRASHTRPRRWLSLGGVGLAVAGLVVQGFVVAFWMGRLQDLGQARMLLACRSQLARLGQGLDAYRSDYGEHPSLGSARSYDRPPEASPVLQGLYDQSDSNPQAYWLLIYRGYARRTAFRCAADGVFVGGPSGGARFGFGGWEESSFAFQPATRHEENLAFPGAPGQSGEVILAGDRAGNEQSLTAGHRRGGNFLSLDGSAAHHERDDGRFGWGGNHVYRADLSPGGQVAAGQDRHLPGHVNDSKLFHGLQPAGGGGEGASD